MTTHIVSRTILVATLALIPWIAGSSAEAAGNAPKASAPPTQLEGRSIVAVDSVEDTYQACLDRIPKVATAGQRMFAEDSCKRDQATRKLIHEMPVY